MNVIIDKIILLLFCILGQLLCIPGQAAVGAFWTGIFISALSYALPGKNVCRIFHVAYAVMIFPLPEFALFLPLVSYDYLPRPSDCEIPPKSFCPPDHDFLSKSSRSGFPPDYCNMRLNAMYFVLPAPILAVLAASLHAFRGGFTGISRPELPQYVLYLYLAVGCALSVILQIKTDEYEKLHTKYRKMRDDDTEFQLLLEERNQSLLEKQNSEICTATLRERNRIAREIHDNVGHMLTRSILMVGALKTVHKEDSLAGPLEQLQVTLDEAMDSIRKSVHDLHDSTVDLQEALRNLIRDYTFCPVTLTYDISSELSREMKYSMISIAKEALVNTARHSNATSAGIMAVEHPGFYQFILRDNGSPPPDRVEPSTSGLPHSSGIGLTNIQSRVDALGGTLSIGRRQGFSIYITFPKEPYREGSIL